MEGGLDFKGLNMIPAIAILLTIAGVILGASVIVQTKFGNTMTECYNSSYTINPTKDGCTNTSGQLASSLPSIGKDDLNLSDQYYTILKSKEGLTTVAEQQPTIAIIAVMVLIISIITGVFVYMKWFA